jgi:hypothetical protein
VGAGVSYPDVQRRRKKNNTHEVPVQRRRRNDATVLPKIRLSAREQRAGARTEINQPGNPADEVRAVNNHENIKRGPVWVRGGGNALRQQVAR